MDIWQDMQRTLADLEARGLRRRPPVLGSGVGPRVNVDGRQVVCLCSNNYLCLASDPAVKQAVVAAVREWGFGSGASRLVSGTMAPHEQLERRLAAFEHRPAAAVFSTGWMANHAAVHALAGPGDLVLSDKLNHASILDAVRSCGADFRTYPHRDTARLQRLLERRRGGARQCVIVTDTLFSMDGDLAPLAELTDLKRRYDAVLLVDEAHATGVLGKHGRGAADLAGVEDGVDVVVGTLSKALGALGGFVAGPEVLIQTLRNTARPYIYTTAPPPAVCAAAMAALEIVQAEPQRRRKLLAMAEALRRNLADLGLDPGDSASQVVPVVLGDARRAVSVSRGLLGAGFLVPAIRPPTVPRGSSRLRVSLCSGHDQADLTRFAETLARSLDEHDSGA